MSLLLDVKNLHVTLKIKSQGLTVSSHTDLRIQQGEILGLIGESGCGKTMTTLALTALTPEKTEVRFDSFLFDHKNIPPVPGMLRGLRGKGIAYIFQEPTSHLNPLFTIGDQIRETLLRHALCDKTRIQDAVYQALEDVGLKPAMHFAKCYAHQLSGGMNQRVLIALALGCRPKLLVADEPTTALDAATKKDIIALIKKIVAEKNLSVIWISHDISLMESFAGRIHVMYAGRIVEEGTCRDILEMPAHPYTQGLVACLPAHAPGKQFYAIPGEPPELIDLPSGCPFHPRCAHAMAICLRQDPDFFSKTTTQKARCFLLQKT